MIRENGFFGSILRIFYYENTLPCQGVYQNRRESMTWKSFGEGNTGDTKSNTEHIVTRAVFTAALRCNVV